MNLTFLFSSSRDPYSYVAEWCCLAIVPSLCSYDTGTCVVYAPLSGLLYYKYTLMMVLIAFTCSCGHLVGCAPYADEFE